MRYLELSCRMLLLAVFLASVVSKVWSRRSFQEFTRTVAELLRWSEPLARRVAGLTVAVELTAVVLLVVPASARYGSGLAVAALAAFTWALFRAVRGGTRVPCRCFGASATPIGWLQVARNLVLIAVGVAGVLIGPGPVSPAGAGVAVVSAWLAAIAVVFLDDLAAVFRPTVAPR
jgi:uncharacterized membrane protein YphA (DoxX/SURF4 family)